MRNSVRYELFHSLQQDILNFSVLLGIFTVKAQVILPLIVNLIIYGLFNDAVSNSVYLESNDRMTSNNKFDTMWKESILT
jgi:hypothetical protein